MTPSPERAAPPWWPSAPPRRVPLDRARVVGAAIDIIDSEGLDALSMRRLAADLNVAVSSLYSHVRSRDELLDLVLDEVLSGARPPEPGPDWSEEIRRTTVEMRERILAHPGLGAAYSRAAGRPGPSMLAITEGMLRAFRSGGVEDSDAVDAIFGLGALISTTVRALNGATAVSLSESPVQFDEFSAKVYPSTAAVADVFVARERLWFDTVLDALLQGLRARAASSGARPDRGRSARRSAGTARGH